MPQTKTKSQIERREDGTIKISMVIPWKDLKPTWDEVLNAAVENAKVPGFRKGKAPKKLIEDQINKTSVREEVLRRHLPKAYIQAIQEHELKPIIDPRIHVHNASGEGELLEESDWIFEAETAEAPSIDLGDYKDKIKTITAKSKIVVPGKEPETPKFDELIKTLLESVKVKIPQVLIEREADRLLAQSLDEIRRLGLTLDQYLASTGRNTQDFRTEYSRKAENDLKLEFALQKVAETEKIVVSDEDIAKSIAGAKTDAERRDMEANRYLIASILRQQKTLDFIKSL